MSRTEDIFSLNCCYCSWALNQAWKPWPRGETLERILAPQVYREKSLECVSLQFGDVCLSVCAPIESCMTIVPWCSVPIVSCVYVHTISGRLPRTLACLLMVVFCLWMLTFAGTFIGVCVCSGCT